MLGCAQTDLSSDEAQWPYCPVFYKQPWLENVMWKGWWLHAPKFVCSWDYCSFTHLLCCLLPSAPVVMSSGIMGLVCRLHTFNGKPLWQTDGMAFESMKAFWAWLIQYLILIVGMSDPVLNIDSTSTTASALCVPPTDRKCCLNSNVVDQ